MGKFDYATMGLAAWHTLSITLNCVRSGHGKFESFCCAAKYPNKSSMASSVNLSGIRGLSSGSEGIPLRSQYLPRIVGIVTSSNAVCNSQREEPFT
eukprot:81364-Amphidinium_carterae.1